jgi:hypothetical protein
MSEESFLSQSPGVGIVPEGRVYELREFVTLKPASGYVKVRHSRTIFDADGHVRQELLPVESSLEQLIRAFAGSPGLSGGTITGEFEDAERARDCARSIEQHFGKAVELSGASLSVAVQSDSGGISPEIAKPTGVPEAARPQSTGR